MADCHAGVVGVGVGGVLSRHKTKRQSSIMMVELPNSSSNSFDKNGTRGKQNGTTTTKKTTTTTTTMTKTTTMTTKTEIEYINVDECIERIGMGPFQRNAVIAAGLCFAADACEMMMLPILSSRLRNAWNLSPHQAASLASCVFAGASIGTVLLGQYGDVRGRRPAFVLSVGLMLIAGLLTASVPSHSFLLVCFLQFIVGLGVGGVTVPFDALAEFLPSAQRSDQLLSVEYYWAAGSIFVPWVAQKTSGSWRWFVICCALPCLAAGFVGWTLVPESPRWLVSKGRREEAMKILRDGATANGKDARALFPQGRIRLLLDDDDDDHDDHDHPEKKTGSNHLRGKKKEAEATIADLFRPKWIRLTILLWVVWAGFAFGYFGTVMASTRVFEIYSAYSNGDGMTAVDDDEFARHNDQQNANESSSDELDYAAVIFSACAEVAGTFLVTVLLQYTGRIKCQVSGYIGGGICLCLLCFLGDATNSAASSSGTADYYSKHLAHRRFFLIVLSFLGRMFEMMGSCVTWVSTAELLSTEIRTTGHSAANAVARLAGLICPHIVAGSMRLKYVGLIMLVLHGLTAFCCSLLPETQGKSLDGGGGGAAALANTGKSNSIKGHENEKKKKYVNPNDTNGEEDEDGSMDPLLITRRSVGGDHV